MTMVALQLIQQGEQIYNDYGQLPRSDLLVSRWFDMTSLFRGSTPNLSYEASLENTLLAEYLLGLESPFEEDMLKPRI